jgi:hypothetical protein
MVRIACSPLAWSGGDKAPRLLTRLQQLLCLERVGDIPARHQVGQGVVALSPSMRSESDRSGRISIGRNGSTPIADGRVGDSFSG